MKKESLRIYRTDHRPEAEYLLIEPWVQYNVNYYPIYYDLSKED